MYAGNFVALLAMAVAIWSAFALFGEPWQTKQAKLVSVSIPRIEIASMPREAPLLPDRMQVGSIVSEQGQ